MMLLEGEEQWSRVWRGRLTAGWRDASDDGDGARLGGHSPTASGRQPGTAVPPAVRHVGGLLCWCILDNTLCYHVYVLVYTVVVIAC